MSIERDHSLELLNSDHFPIQHKSKMSSENLPPKLQPMNPYIHAASAQKTRDAYRADIQHYEQSGGLLPATVESVLTYLQGFAAKLNPRTLSRRLTALKNWHIYQGFADPTAHPAVRKTLRGIHNTYGKPRTKASALLPEQLQQLVAYLESEATLAACRDSALLQIGYFGALRRAELVNVQYEHIKRFKKGIEILIPRSKADQGGEGQYCAIPYGHARLCPIRALDVWLHQSGIIQGPLFRQIDRWGRLGENALTPLALTQIIKKRARECELLYSATFSGHSLRRGFATSASRQGASLKAIMRQGRWRHIGTVLGYIEEGQRFEDNAAALILQNEHS